MMLEASPGLACQPPRRDWVLSPPSCVSTGGVVLCYDDSRDLQGQIATPV